MFSKNKSGGELMEKVGVALLNYNGYEDTINCIETLFEQQDIILSIVIVDNDSTNNSFDVIKEFVDINRKHNDIEIIRTESNLGFARGNNVGIDYLRNMKDCNFVFVLNNDTLIKDSFTIKRLVGLYSKGIGVINPACCDFEGNFQKPYRVSQGNMWNDYFQAIILTIWQIIKGIINIDYSIHKRNDRMFDHKQFKYIIQGNAYILTPDFFKYYSQIYPKTFLYFEELFLLWYLQKAGLKTIYDDKTIILHKESGCVPKTTRSYKIRKGNYMLKSIVFGTTLLFMKLEKIQREFN